MPLVHLSRFVLSAFPLALLAPLCWLAQPSAVLAQAKRSDSVVKVTVMASKPDDQGKQVATLVLDIEKGWHLYANPVGLKDLESVQTTVKVSEPDRAEVLRIEYPSGKLQKDAVVGNYRIYEERVTIKAQLQRQKGDASPVELNVKLQACSDRSCLLPATVKVSVP